MCDFILYFNDYVLHLCVINDDTDTQYSPYSPHPSCSLSEVASRLSSSGVPAYFVAVDFDAGGDETLVCGFVCFAVAFCSLELVKVQIVG